MPEKPFTARVSVEFSAKFDGECVNAFTNSERNSTPVKNNVRTFELLFWRFFSFEG